MSEEFLSGAVKQTTASSDTATDRRQDLREARLLLIHIAGYGFFFAWVLLAIVTPTFSNALFCTPSQMFYSRLVFFVSVFITLCFFWKVSFRGRMQFILGSTTVPLMSFVLAVSGELPFVSPLFLYCAWVVLGMGSACLLALWSPLLAQVDYNYAGRFIAVASICAIILALMVSLLQYISAYVASFLALLSILMQIAYGRMALATKDKKEQTTLNFRDPAKPGFSQREAEFSAISNQVSCEGANGKITSKSIQVSWRLDLDVFLYCFGLGVSAYAASSLLPVQIHTLWSTLPLLCGLIAAMVFYWDNRRKRIITSTKLKRALLLTIVLFCAPLLFFNESSVLIAGSIAALTLTLSFLSDLTEVVIGVCIYGFPPVRYVCRTKLPVIAALVFGYGGGYLYSLSLQSSLDQTLPLAIIIAVFVAAGFVSTFIESETPPSLASAPFSKQHSAQGKNGSDKHRAGWKQSCKVFAEKYALTERQSDILFMLSKGRTARYIAETLFISESTAKSHIYAIYKKSGLHSQQELIDSLELIDSIDE